VCTTLTLPHNGCLAQGSERTVRRLRESAQRLIEVLPSGIEELLRLLVNIIAVCVDLVASGADQLRREHSRDSR